MNGKQCRLSSLLVADATLVDRYRAISRKRTPGPVGTHGRKSRRKRSKHMCRHSTVLYFQDAKGLADPTMRFERCVKCGGIEVVMPIPDNETLDTVTEAQWLESSSDERIAFVEKERKRGYVAISCTKCGYPTGARMCRMCE